MKHIFKNPEVVEDGKSNYQGTTLCGKKTIPFIHINDCVGFFLSEITNRECGFFEYYKKIPICQECLNHPSTLLHLLKIL